MTGTQPSAALRLTADEQGLAFDLPARGELVIGRARGSDILLTDPTVSRRHAVLTVTPYGILVTDQGATSGTFVNDRPVYGAEPVQVGDTIRFGELAMQLVGAAPPPDGPERRRRRFWPVFDRHRAAGRTNTGH